MSQGFELFDELPDESTEYYDEGLCDCPSGPDAKLEIDAGDVVLSCAVCGKSLLAPDDTGSVYMDSIPVDVECIQEHNHHWDTIGCDCDFYWALKTRSLTK
jgi:hypothetical protein